jgi:hypothetical protein
MTIGVRFLFRGLYGPGTRKPSGLLAILLVRIAVSLDGKREGCKMSPES